MHMYIYIYIYLFIYTHRVIYRAPNVLVRNASRNCAERPPSPYWHPGSLWR